jgi:hypothetical protein
VLAGQGMSLPVIGRLLGHTQTATTARYAHTRRRGAERRSGARQQGHRSPEVNTVLRLGFDFA